MGRVHQKKANKPSKPKKRTKSNTSSSNGGGQESKKVPPSSWSITSRSLIAPVPLVFLFLLLGLVNYENIPTIIGIINTYYYEASSSSSTQRQLTVSKKFLSRQSQVYIIPNFLPNETAISWRQKMRQLWNQTLDHRQQQQQQVDAACDADATGGEGTCGGGDGGNAATSSSSSSSSSSTFDGFTFATNNDGQMLNRMNNAKVRSLMDIDQRRVVARAMKQRNLFSYRKWELPPEHPLLLEMEHTLTEPALLSKVNRIIRTDYPTAKLQSSREMSDIFVTHYAHEDFLSPHNDGASGSWAVVVNLVDDDFDGTIHGGGLQFQCPGNENYLQNPIEYCETLYPKFNTAVIFATHFIDQNTGRQEMGPAHQVLDVLREEGGRYAITGWWMDINDVVSDHFKLERDKMKARGKKK